MKNISEHIKQLTPYEYELLNTICDHSTIIYRVRRAKSHYDLEPDFRDMVDKVSNSLMEYKTKISLAKV